MIQMQDLPEIVQMSHIINGVMVIGIRAAEIVSAKILFKEALLDTMIEMHHTGGATSALVLRVCDHCDNRTIRKGY